MNLAHGHLIDLEEKSVSETEDAFKFVGYAAIFGNKDLGNDIIVKGAFEESLKNHGNPLLLFNHKMDELPIGVIEHAEEDRKGLKVEGELPKDDPVSRRVGIALKARKSGARALKGMSIGYRAEKKSHKGDVRYLEQVRLFEASFVNLPMNPLAGVEHIKSERIDETEWDEMTEREREACLVSLGMSKGIAKKFVRLDREDRGGTKGQREAGGVTSTVESLDLSGLLTAIRSTAAKM